MKYGWKCGWTRYTGGGQLYSLDLWIQPYHWWLWTRIYHWWDMRAHKVPGLRRIERIIDRRKQKHESESDFYIPISNQRDLTCYHNFQRKQKLLLHLDLTEEQYEKLTGTGGAE